MAKDISSGFQIFADALSTEMTGADIRSKGPFGLDAKHYRALEIIVIDGARRRADIVAATRETKVEGVFARLVALGLVSVDERGVTPTPRGHALIRSTRPTVRARTSRTESGKRAIVRGLERILGALSSDSLTTTVAIPRHMSARSTAPST
jgi:hypothetical protein